MRKTPVDARRTMGSGVKILKPTVLIAYPCHHLCGFIATGRSADAIAEAMVAHLNHSHPKQQAA